MRKLIKTPLSSSSPSSSLPININLIGPTLLFHHYLISMSLFYQVMGSPRCPNPKNKKHAGIKITPSKKSKETFAPGDVVIFNCETNETKQSIKCLDSGKWNEIPSCPDPANSTCPDLGPLLHGTYNATGPYKVGTVVVFRCDNEFPNLNLTTSSNNLMAQRKPKDLKEADAGSNKQQSLDGQKYTISATTTPVINVNINEVEPAIISPTAPITPMPMMMMKMGQNQTATSFLNLTQQQPSITNNVDVSQMPIPHFSNSNDNNLLSTVRYNLTGHRLLRCQPSGKWNHPVPTCTPVLPEPASNFGLMLTSAFLIILPILIFIAIAQLFIRWRKRQQQRERWKQYFTDYKYRHSKTSITFGMRPTNPAIIPVTDL